MTARRGASVPGRSSREDKNEGKMDRAKGRMKEAGGALSGDKGKKREWHCPAFADRSELSDQVP
jgi:hypothetical protein